LALPIFWLNSLLDKIVVIIVTSKNVAPCKH